MTKNRLENRRGGGWRDRSMKTVARDDRGAMTSDNALIAMLVATSIVAAVTGVDQGRSPSSDAADQQFSANHVPKDDRV